MCRSSICRASHGLRRVEVEAQGLYAMPKSFTLEYWIDDDWYVGRLKEVPGVFSQGASLEELEENIRDAYHMLTAEEGLSHPGSQTKDLEIEV